MSPDKNKINNSETAKERSEAENKILLRRKRIIAIIFVVITLLLFLGITYYAMKAFSLSSEEGTPVSSLAANFQKIIQSYGNKGVLVAFGIQILQVVVSPIPGGVIEIGLGLCFGWFWGAVICLVGVAIASTIIMLFVKKLGIKVVELFFSTDKINEMRFINSEKKLEKFVFLVYIIPGTPKDPLIFFFGLTKIRISSFVIITTLARLPSIFCSTVGGELLVEQNYIGFVAIFAVLGVLALLGLGAYNKILAKLQDHKEKKAAEKADK